MPPRERPVGTVEGADRSAPPRGSRLSRSVVALVLAYNEEEALPGVLAEQAECPGWSVVVVSDGSTDGTGACARRAGAAPLQLPFNAGVAAAEQTGFLYARSPGPASPSASTATASTPRPRRGGSWPLSRRRRPTSSSAPGSCARAASAHVRAASRDPLALVSPASLRRAPDRGPDLRPSGVRRAGNRAPVARLPARLPGTRIEPPPGARGASGRGGAGDDARARRRPPVPPCWSTVYYPVKVSFALRRGAPGARAMTRGVAKTVRAC